MSNRKATASRIITSTPVCRTRETKFGPIKERTNQFVHTVSFSVPKYDQIMTAREKEIRKKLKRHKSRREPLPEQEVSALRKELAEIVYGVTPTTQEA